MNTVITSGSTKAALSGCMDQNYKGVTTTVQMTVVTMMELLMYVL